VLSVPEAERRQFVGVPLQPDTQIPEGRRDRRPDALEAEKVLTWQQADQILASIELGDTCPPTPPSGTSSPRHRKDRLKTKNPQRAKAGPAPAG
jgi:hypothetical protein